MHELWTSIVAPVLDALRPTSTLDVGDGDTRLAWIVSDLALAWDGRVASWQPKGAQPVSEDRASDAQKSPNLEIRDIGTVEELQPPRDLELALLHPPGRWSPDALLDLVARAATRAGSPLPVILMHRLDEGGLLAARELKGARPNLTLQVLGGLGGVIILAEEPLLRDGHGRLAALLEDLRLSPAAEAHLAAVEAARVRAQAGAEQAWERARKASLERADNGALLAELEDSRARTRAHASARAIESSREPARGDELRLGSEPESPRPAPSPPPIVPKEPPALSDRIPELSQNEIRRLLCPSELLAELGWQGEDEELSLPIPLDLRGMLVEDGAPEVAVVAAGEELALRQTLCSVLDRAAEPIAVSLVLDGGTRAALSDLTNRLRSVLPQMNVIHDGPPPPGAHVLAEGDELPWGWPHDEPGAPAPAIAYLLPGLPREGSGGSHSLFQEALGLREMGVAARICLPSAALSTAVALYGEHELFAPYRTESQLVEAIGQAEVVVASEYTSVRLAELIAGERPDVVSAYYVQDYEPLFAPAASTRSDQALLSYRAVPGQVMFAKTHWLRNIVAARHGLPVAKVTPSLDRDLFYPRGREPREASLVAAMVRPRTPRRRAGATLAALAALAHAGIETVAFGCDAEAFAELCARSDIESPARVTHLGLLNRADVAELMRRTDVFIDASAYQAFGRTGLEAMACGAVPVLPAIGGVAEYAQHAHNALILDRDEPAAIVDAVLELLADRDRLTALRQAGERSAARFSVERAAQSQLELFRAVTARRRALAKIDA
jgi:Glycosyl transferases group 1